MLSVATHVGLQSQQGCGQGYPKRVDHSNVGRWEYGTPIYQVETGRQSKSASGLMISESELAQLCLQASRDFSSRNHIWFDKWADQIRMHQDQVSVTTLRISLQNGHVSCGKAGGFRIGAAQSGLPVSPEPGIPEPLQMPNRRRSHTCPST
jgi:hypothetical protein